MAQDCDMDRECCCSVISDFLNVTNHKVTVQFIWPTTKLLKCIRLRLINAVKSQALKLNISTQDVHVNSIFVRRARPEDTVETSVTLAGNSGVKHNQMCLCG
eukprot:155439_1